MELPAVVYRYICEGIKADIALNIAVLSEDELTNEEIEACEINLEQAKKAYRLIQLHYPDLESYLEKAEKILKSKKRDLDKK